MRTPPPVLPPRDESAPAYKLSFMDRLGPDGAMEFRGRVVAAVTFVIVLPIAMKAAQFRPLTAGYPLLTGLVGASLAAALMHFMMVRMPNAVGAGAGAVTLPSGRTTPYEAQYSYEDSLAARGDVAGALEAFERILTDHPEAVAPRLRAAELYATRGGNPARAAELFRQVRTMPEATGRDTLYASSRLVDLYDGALDEPGRALVELRRIIELYPGTPIATHARDALPRLKSRLLDAPSDP